MTQSITLESFGSGYTVLVVGGTGGIGEALITHLAQTSAAGRIVAASRSPRDFPALPIPVSTHAVDVLDASSIERLARHMADQPPAVVINTVGLLHDGDRTRPEKRLEDIDPEHMARAFAVNATGAALVFQHFLPVMKDVPRGVIATLSARVGSIEDNRLGGWYAYRASKAAQNMLTRTASIEARRRAPGVMVVGLHPGTVDTRLSAPFQSRVPAERLFTPEYSATRLLSVIDGLQTTDSGGVFAWDGSVIRP